MANTFLVEETAQTKRWSWTQDVFLEGEVWARTEPGQIEKGWIKDDSGCFTIIILQLPLEERGVTYHGCFRN